MAENKKLKFKLFNKVYVKDLSDGQQLLSADYTTTSKDDNGSFFLQFDMEEPEKVKDFVLKNGFFRLEYANNHLTAVEIETQKLDLLEESTAVETIKKEIDTFFNNLHVYEELKITRPKRGALIHSQPGVGKTSTLTKIARDYVAKGNTCVLIWPSDVVEPEDLKDFLSIKSDWSNIERFILVIEDIGGGSDIYGSVHKSVPASLLNFLDGVEDSFKKPTFIIATTNNPSALLDSLTSRPGRFDVVVGLPLPKKSERIRFLKFFADTKWNLNDADVDLVGNLTEGFSAAHLKETYVRSRLFNISMIDSAKEIKKWIERVKEGKLNVKEQNQQGIMGFGNSEEFDD